jgi:hypothetical protein
MGSLKCQYIIRTSSKAIPRVAKCTLPNTVMDVQKKGENVFNQLFMMREKIEVSR